MSVCMYVCMTTIRSTEFVYFSSCKLAIWQ